MKAGRTLTAMAQELQRQLQSKKDYLVDTSVLTMAENGQEVSFGENAFGIGDHMHDQISEKLKIPRQYYKRLAMDIPTLLALNVNTLFRKEPEKRMVRTLDGKARALLSSKYRPIDNFDLAEITLPKIQAAGCEIVSCELTERRMYIKAISPKVQAEVKPGDIVQAGLVLSNSEIGVGSVEVSPLIYRLVCSNGMISADSSLRRHHIGKRFDESDETVQFYSQKTLAADNQAFFMKVSDVINGSLSQTIFTVLLDKMKRATGQKLERDPVKVIEEVTERFHFSEEESGGVLKHLINGGDLSQYGLLNAVTRLSQDVESYDRATELEGVGGQILDLSASAWRELSIA